MITENVSTLKLNKLTNEQYERELDAGNINENEFYLTPDDSYSKSDIEMMLPKAVVANAEYDGDCVNISSPELIELRKSKREVIVYLNIGEFLNDTTNSVAPSTIVNLCSNISNENSSSLKIYADAQIGADWHVYTTGTSNYFLNSPFLILAVKGDGYLGSSFEYVHWLNPPRANG